MLPRVARVLLVAVLALSLAALLNLALAQPFASPRLLAAAPDLTGTASPTPAVTPTATPIVQPTPWFSATVVLTTSAPSAALGEALTVTAQLATTGSCGYAIYDVTLRQSEPLFAHVEPDDNVIGPPGENPAVWRLAARQAGVTTFTVDFYGETNCNGAWQWTTVRGSAPPVTVTDAGAALHLPFVSRFDSLLK